MVPELALLSMRTSLMVILPFAVLLGIVLSLGPAVSRQRDHRGAGLRRTGSIAVRCRGCGHAGGGAAGRLGGVHRWSAGRAPRSRRCAPRPAQRRRAATAARVRSVRWGRASRCTSARPAADGSLQDVFVQRDLPGRDARVQVLVARSARQRLAPDGDAWLVELDEGTATKACPARRTGASRSFARQLLKHCPARRQRLRGPPRVDGLASRELLASGQPRQIAELHWRLAWVIDVIVLGLVAVPLARLAPRQGRYARRSLGGAVVRGLCRTADRGPHHARSRRAAAACRSVVGACGRCRVGLVAAARARLRS